MVPLLVTARPGWPARGWYGWSLGIRARLFMLALVTLAPLVAVLVLQDYYHLAAARERADSDASRLALLKAGDVDHHLLAVEGQLAALRAVVSADPASASANAAAFSTILEETAGYVAGVAAHTLAGGSLGEAWRGGQDDRLPATPVRDLIADAEAAPGLVIGPLLTRPAPLPPVVPVARAATDRTGAAVVLTLALRPDLLPPLIDTRGLPPGLAISLVDARGTLLARSSPTEPGTGSPPPAGTILPPRLVEGGPAPSGQRGDLFDDRVVGYAVTTRAPWIVYVDAPEEVALVAARTVFVRDLMLGGLMLGFALLLAWIIAERITAPIRRLTADAAALGTGQLSRRTPVRSDDELGVLARVFNETAGAIEQLVDDLRRTQAEVRALNAHLETRVRDRTAQLAAINTELEAFSFAVSHDLRAPLRRVSRFGEALREDFGDRLDDEGNLMLDRLLVGTEQMSQLIDDLLRLSRVSQAELTYAPVDLGALAAEAADELRLAHPDHPVTITIADDLVVHGDARLLKVVLHNLLANAWKFTRGRPGPHVEVGAIPHDETRAFYVRDNGVGFDPAHRDKLFRAFQRLHDERDFEGTGVGLATVQRIVHRHGGRVWADGGVGSGATFWFTVPDWLEGG